MQNYLKYTTETIKKKVKEDKNISQELKDEEDKKIVITDEAFALCDLLYELKKELKLRNILNG